ncbi:hypothetical protein YC2023_009572 [Brassica napus]
MEWYQKGKRKRRGRVEGVASDAASVADAGGGAAALGFLQLRRISRLSSLILVDFDTLTSSSPHQSKVEVHNLGILVEHGLIQKTSKNMVI